MIYAPLTTGPDAPLNSAVRQLVERRIGCLPVVDHDGKLLGIFTESDALLALAPLLDQLPRSARLKALETLTEKLLDERSRVLLEMKRWQNMERAITAQAEEPVDRSDLATQRSAVESMGRLADLAARRLDQIDRALERQAAWQSELARYDGGMRSASALVRYDGRRPPHDRLPIGIGDLRNQYLARLYGLQRTCVSNDPYASHRDLFSDGLVRENRLAWYRGQPIHLGDCSRAESFYLPSISATWAGSKPWTRSRHGSKVCAVSPASSPS